ncbi:MAG: RnfABCDGE type electron transport complex subunit B [Oscillospiraceae bacterium]
MEFLTPVLIVTVIGILSGLILALASKFMAVKVDERFDKVRECLPGANCGACGFAGCDAYANALLKGETPTNLCTPGGADTAKALSCVLGVECEEVVPQYAVVKCNGCTQNTQKLVDFVGAKTCKAAAMYYGGDGTCAYSCLGYGDCEKACPYDAIHIIDGVAKVDKLNCIGCGICAKTCPKSIINIIPTANNIAVTCSSKAKGAVTRKVCSVGCIGCKKCEKACPNGAITVNDNLAYIDPSKCTNCGLCMAECPVKAINIVGCTKNN